jgi:hypothetical protein
LEWRGWTLALLLLFGGRPAAFSEIRDGGIDPADLGKGDWIYALADATNRLGGHIGSVTNERSLMLFYRSAGIRYLIVKAGTSDQLFRGCYSGPQFTRALVDVAHANGLWIFGYNRSFGANIRGEIAVADYVFSQGADGFVWDAEAEWENTSPWIGSSGPSKAWQLCSTVRSNWPSKFLAHAPFPIVSYHASFPYKEFGYWCDAVMPQIYHSGWTGVTASASGGINWADVNWANWQNSLLNSNQFIHGTHVYWTNAIKPLAPVAEVYGTPGRSPCAGIAPPLNAMQVMEFMDYLSVDPNCPSAGGYRGASFWRADLHSATQWGHIKASTLGAATGAVNDIVLDDADASMTGSWDVIRTFSNGFFFGSGCGTDTNSFGTNYLVHPPGTGAAVVEFRPRITVPGDYRVYQWHPLRPDASSRVPFVIRSSAGEQKVFANQRTNAGNWSLLGRFNFSSGTNCSVGISDEIPETNAVAMVDAVKLVLVPK